ncbi:hypothetical protein EFK50_11745 [Nocardioides marmoriginsengisoli]|uniref:Acyl-CoA dehydrogenase/oxidase C-terminal domain-containing protein n=1 Tax=Nocardioides marmoriginsengisoli TaxID=661483 RepID=A0A3N0CG64_9ACTN|nr:acyl-CoA dehydrogenase family protein [Nocardioides marmoriginsengisoli]RNL62438.1 hypothetical protein EFK50_11745 [Nocardioides marmoriginsengisoli]
MSTDWPYSEEQRDFQRTLARVQPALPEVDESGAFPWAHWQAVGRTGALALTSPETGASALDLVAAGEALGHGGCPGPWWQSLLVIPVLEDAEAAMAGEVVVTAGTADRVPWAAVAERVFELGEAADRSWLLRPVRVAGVRESWISLGHEPVLAGDLVGDGPEIAVPARIELLTKLGLAAYLSGAGRRVLTDVVAYTAQRTQFRTRIGDFAAVAHPLAECDARVRAAAGLSRRAAAVLDEAGGGAGESRSVHTALRAAAAASREAVYQAHQAYGAIGFSQEGPLAWLGQRVAQLATDAEDLARDAVLVAD